MLWDERFKGSQVWQYVEQVRGHMNASTMPESPSEQDALAYVGMVVELLEKRRSDSDAREITPAMLSSLGSSVSNLATYVESVNNGSQQWSQIIPYADMVLDALASWPPLKIARYLSGISSATEAFQTKAAQAIDVLSSRATTASAELDKVQSKQQTLGESIDTEKQRIAETIATFKTEAADAVSEVRDEQGQQLSELLTQWDKANADASQEAAQTLTNLKGLEEQARNVVHATTSHIVATDYGRYARNKTIAAWTCDIAAALVGAAGLAVIVYHLLSIEPNADSNLGLSLTRLAVSLGTLGIAGLLGRRGQQHHLEARAAKRTDLALRQILPFTANLDDDEQRDIVRQFTDRVFIRGEIDAEASQPAKRRVVQARARDGEAPEEAG